mmetsp:Transcript_23819/g.42202  ORF Transcript_23819/g.42202 Transcript_23819/m.42202 type:complete len:261 (-) Transcript_23819:73-855(-)|eukprot:CAMPEP_0197516880 /NCGR_PEP_ID=MMETSP1318-20131121/1799_1 /TAXON_ID=552666 /ORGANISM="Partenskyella glossopodia, Strain RCC365" /LENGTH=260 /DNA_ID=CAMNT_0043065953 /DNA_START=57 /DNA_END=839 /DNA_ORIENTATION=+
MALAHRPSHRARTRLSPPRMLAAALAVSVGWLATVAVLRGSEPSGGLGHAAGVVRAPCKAGAFQPCVGTGLGGRLSSRMTNRGAGMRQLRVGAGERRDAAGFIVDEDLTYDTNVYCQNLGGTAQLEMNDEAKAFAQKSMSQPGSVTMADTIEMTQKNFEYLPVSFSLGETQVAKGDKEDVSRVLSFAILAGVPVANVAEILGDEDLKTNGWGYVKFPNGLSLIPKEAAYDYETDPNQLLSEASTLQGEGDWDPNSDIWIP